MNTYAEFPIGGGKITVKQDVTDGVYDDVHMNWQGKSKSSAFWSKFNAAKRLAIEWGKRKGQAVETNINVDRTNSI